MKLEQEIKKALDEIGEIKPWWSEEDNMYVFEHPSYPFVMHADPDIKKAKAGYLRAITGFVEDRLAGMVASDIDRVTSGRGGARPGSGRPRKEPTLQRRLPKDMALWLDEKDNLKKVQDLMQG